MSSPTAQNPSTATLVRRAKQSEHQAVNQLLAKHRQRLLRFVDARLDRRLVGRIDPADVVQEAVLEAARRLPSYLVHQPVPFYPWLRRIAHDRLVDLQRHHLAQKRTVLREKRPNVELSDFAAQRLSNFLLAPGSSPSQHLRNEEARERVRDLLKRLSPTDQEVLVLRYVEQVSPAEAAAVMEISQEAFSKRHMRALKRLRQLIDDNSDMRELT